MRRTGSIDDYFANIDQWQDELARIRAILRSTPLTEEVKWGAPCYTYDGKNVVGLGAFKSHFGLWFHQGALLHDGEGVLINAQEGKTRAMRQWRMTSPEEIRPAVIKRYVKESIALLEQGRSIGAERDKPVVMPPELDTAFRDHPRAAAAFGRLRKGQQREYADYVTEAKRQDTKLRRIEKILPMIAAGQGLNDRYR